MKDIRRTAQDPVTQYSPTMQPRMIAPNPELQTLPQELASRIVTFIPDHMENHEFQEDLIHKVFHLGTICADKYMGKMIRQIKQ